jgi:hypothetical protein
MQYRYPVTGNDIYNHTPIRHSINQSRNKLRSGQSRTRCNLPVVVGPRCWNIHSFSSWLRRMVASPGCSLVVGSTMLAGHDTRRRRRSRGLVVRVAGELTGRSRGGGRARSWPCVTGCTRGSRVVIACRRICARCCISGYSYRGTLLGPWGRVACRRRQTYKQSSNIRLIRAFPVVMETKASSFVKEKKLWVTFEVLTAVKVSSALKMEAVCSSEILLCTYKSTDRKANNDIFPTMRTSNLVN